MRILSLLTIAALQFILQTTSKRVVVFPFFQASHIVSSVKVARALAELNHEVWICVPQFLQEKGILNTEGVNVIVYAEDLGNVEEELHTKVDLLSGFWNDSQTWVQMFFRSPDVIKEIMTKVLTSPSFVAGLQKVKPEFFVIDSMPLMTSAILLPYKFDVPFATLGVVYDIFKARVPFSPAAVPCIMCNDSFSTQSCFTQRLKSLLYSFMMLSDPFWYPELAAGIAPNKPFPSSSWSLMAKCDLFLVENDVVLFYANPMLPNTVMIGGTTAVPAKPLNVVFDKIANQSPNGFVLVTFGSSVSTFPTDVTQKLTTAFLQLPFHVVWRVKMNSPDLSKITTSNWIPQNDLLGHRNGTSARVFVSHCGAWGLYEALYQGVPMLCLPLFADQFFNGHRIQEKGFGRFADIRTISAEALAALIQEVALNDTYRNNIGKASKLFKELYKSPVHEAARWLDHVLTHGGAHLRSVGQMMPLYQFLLLDVLGIAVICVVAFVSILYCIFRLCWVKCIRKSGIEPNKKNKNKLKAQ